MGNIKMNLFIFYILAFVSCSEFIILTDKTFEDLVIGSNDTWMIDFYQPGCRKCEVLQPKLKKVAKRLQNRVKFGKIDANEYSEMYERFNIKKVPWIMIFH